VREVRRATGPGRVNLIGDHTDYNLGLALPIAIDLGIRVELVPADRPVLDVVSTAFGAARLDLAPLDDPETVRSVEPAWLRPVAGAIVASGRSSGGSLRIDGDLPVGAGLSSSAALCAAIDEVLCGSGSVAVVARRCQRAEHLAGVPVGMLDPLVCAGGRRGCALLVDAAIDATTPVPLPEDLSVVVFDPGASRDLRDTQYAGRVEECRLAAASIGPLGAASESDVATLRDPVLRARARHVVRECARVRAFVDSLAVGDRAAAGACMLASHRSLADDYAVSTPVLDALVGTLARTDGVYGARLTGAGFGGSVVALCRPDVDPAGLARAAGRAAGGAVGHAGTAVRWWQVAAAYGTVTARERR
jgi:galactokinase